MKQTFADIIEAFQPIKLKKRNSKIYETALKGGKVGSENATANLPTIVEGRISYTAFIGKSELKLGETRGCGSYFVDILGAF